MAGFTKASLYARCKNKMHVVTMALLNNELVSDIDAWYCLSKPLSEELHRTRVLAKDGHEGTAKMLLQEARGSTSLQTVQKVFEQLMAPDTWEAQGLWFGAKLRSRFVQKLKAEDPLVCLQDRRWSRLFDMTLTLVRHKLLNASVAMFLFPQALARFLSDNESERLVALVDLYESYQAHKAAEATRTKFCRTFVARSPFQLQIMKDIVRALERSSWQLSKEVTELVYNIFHGFAITLNEEGFGKARAQEKTANQAHEMPDVHAWQCLSFTGVLAASGYDEIATDTALPNIKWPSSLYHIAHRAAHPELKQVTTRQNWTSLTQAGMPMVACEMTLLVKAVREKQNMAELKLG